MAKPKNAFLAKLQAQAQAKEALKTEANKELDEDKSKKKELVVIKRNLAYQLRAILGPEAWEVRKTLFPFLRDFWDG